MEKSSFQDRRRLTDALAAFVVLVFLLWVTYGLLFTAPYPGFYFNPYDGRILQIYKRDDSETTIRAGDIVKRIGSNSLDEYQNNNTLNLFNGVQPGESIEIEVLRDGKRHVISWTYAGFNTAEFLARFFNIWWLAYIFWFLGMAIQIFIRPRDVRRHVLAAANHLTALFVMFGSVSAWHVWGTSILMRAVAWLILPVYIHFHWIFPMPFRRIPEWGWIIFYAVGFGIAIAELFLRVPTWMFFVSLLLAFGGSIILLIFHFILQPGQRREVRFLAAAAFIALFPAMVISFAGSSDQMPESGPLSLVALPILPGAYFYLLYRRRLGGMEIRANRAISIYIFLTLLGTVLLIGVGYSGLIKVSQEALAFASVLIALIITFIGIVAFPAFQAMIERRLLGIKLPAQSMVADFSTRIITSTSLPDMIRLLEDEVFPSLLVRQYAFVQVASASAKTLLSKNVTRDQVPEGAVTNLLVSFRTINPLPLANEDQPLDWARLILPLRFGPDLIGAWLLGRRDPDDLYPQAEIPILQSLANQTAIALSNILQAERLRKMYEDDIDRNEKSRLQLALDLHDSVLDQLAVLRLSVDEAHVSANFQRAYGEVVKRLREIITDLRPPMLSYGLKSAIEELADNLMERSKDTVNVMTDIQVEGEARYAEKIERQLFRIIQEACGNALRHSRATQIVISARLMQTRIQLSIEDNGIGLETSGPVELDDLLANQHFGLIGMVERAMLIGAKVELNSRFGAGVQVQVALNLTDSTL